MKLRDRLTYFASLAFGIVFLGASLLIYFVFYTSSERMYFDNLRNTSLLTAFYYLEKDELSQSEHSSIRQEFRSTIQSTHVAIYNAKNEVEYGELYNDPNINTADLEKARNQDKFYFKRASYFYYGIYYPDNQGNFVVFVKMPTDVFQAQANTLLIILVSVLCVGLVFIFLLSKRLSKIAYKPLRHVVDQINHIDYSNLNQGIATTNTDDEIDELIQSYNQLFARLSENFLIQKNFINYVSHEFKTPLTAISGNLEVFAQKERTPEEYQKVVKDALENVYKIESILSNLLLMSGLQRVNTAHTSFRIDEVLWNITDVLNSQDTNNQARLQIDLQINEPALLEIQGNETLIQLALFNLIENALKYSHPKRVVISLEEVKGNLQIQIQDCGTGISAADLEFVSETFYRGKNTENIKGSGIGLSLAKLILEQHHIPLHIASELGVGTTVTLLFKKQA